MSYNRYNTVNLSLNCVGSYGSRARHIVDFTLAVMFPDTAEVWQTRSAISPFSPAAFRVFVLVSEIILILVQEDLGLTSKDEAYDLLHASKPYGDIQFDDCDDPQMDETFSRVCNAKLRAIRLGASSQHDTESTPLAAPAEIPKAKPVPIKRKQRIQQMTEDDYPPVATLFHELCSLNMLKSVPVASRAEAQESEQRCKGR